MLKFIKDSECELGAVLECPVCGHNNLHQGKTEVYTSINDQIGI